MYSSWGFNTYGGAVLGYIMAYWALYLGALRRLTSMLLMKIQLNPDF